MPRLSIFLLLCTAVAAVSSAAKSFEPLLLQSPTLSRTQIAFSYGGEIWIVSRDGGDAQRLVTGSDRLSGPIFSPDGTQIAYSGNYNGNEDVYVVPAAGGAACAPSAAVGPAYTIIATPVAGQSQAADQQCTAFAVDSVGQQYAADVTGAYTAAAQAYCWAN